MFSLGWTQISKLLGPDNVTVNMLIGLTEICNIISPLKWGKALWVILLFLFCDEIMVGKLNSTMIGVEEH